jgi:hypothetical protein
VGAADIGEVKYRGTSKISGRIEGEVLGRDKILGRAEQHRGLKS